MTKKGSSVAVVVPSYNEEHLIEQVFISMPKFVDVMYLVDDASTDGTVSKVRKLIKKIGKERLRIIEMPKNSGVGAAIVRGYQEGIKDEMDVMAVMAGDAQMDPDDLENVVMPVIAGEADYVKGNRLFTGEAWQIIPRYRYLGNAFLSLLTKISSGYWHLSDSQTGYTAISNETANILPLEDLFPRYGYPNHILAMLNVYRRRVRDVPVRPVYNIGEKSGIRLWREIPGLTMLLTRNFLWRMMQKYVIRDFHPLIFFYLMALLLLGFSVPLFARMILLWLETGNVPPINALTFIFTGITGLQSLFFAMWFDMEYNKDLR
jgi:glycosyltransferase involved in cell wall biosynthesis